MENNNTLHLQCILQSIRHFHFQYIYFDSINGEAARYQASFHLLKRKRSLVMDTESGAQDLTLGSQEAERQTRFPGFHPEMM
mgnify:CR=1 FL=1